MLSVAVIKVDNFADINARYSSATAQRVISEMGCLFKSTLCTNDLIGRYADDKIGVVLMDAEPSMFTTLCARLIDKVQSHDWETLVSGLSVNVSLGLSEANADKLGLLGGAEKNLSRQYAATPTALGA